MRYLSKIHFINSAHVPFATIELNGNVHFTGTQGVGKSTLLRAILFFYNADKYKLGIRQQGQRQFDDFYLPSSSSYIAYEVEREDDRPFSVIVFKHRGRAAYRFVDAPFDLAWIVDSDGIATADPSVVRLRVAKTGVHISNIIDGYQTYRDILYGNPGATLQKELRRYYLLQSQKYQNLPRIIQNVFLNERVDADFIKDSIIKSINESDELAINLRDYREKLADFDEEYRDLELWTKKNRQGRIEVKDKADKLISKGHEISALQIQCCELCGYLVYAMKQTENEKPILLAKGDVLRQQLNNLIARRDSKEAEFQAGLSKLNQRLGVVDDKLLECKTLKKRYAELNIAEMLEFAAQEDALCLKRRQLEIEKLDLEANYHDITAKYNDLIERQRLALDQFRQLYEQQFIEFKKAKDLAIDGRRKQCDQQISDIEKDYDNQNVHLTEDLEDLSSRISDKKVKLELAKTEHPMAKEITDCQAALAQTKMQLHEKEESNKARQQEITRLEREGAHAEEKLKWEQKAALRVLEDKITAFDRKVEQEDQLLAQAHGSMCEWLDLNVPNWKNTIGKVADERRVLYNTNLFPKLRAGESSLFGVEIDLNELASEVRTPAEIQQSRDSLLEACAQLKKELDSLSLTHANEIENLHAEYNKKIRVLRNDIKINQQLIAQLENEGRQATLRLDNLLQQQQVKIDDKVKLLEEEHACLITEKNELVEQSKGLRQTKNRRINEARNAFNRFKKEVEQQIKAEKDRVDNTVKEQATVANAKIQALESSRDNELVKGGADLSLLKACQEQLDDIEKKLQQIAANRDIVAEYKVNKNKFLDHEDEFKAERRKLESQKEVLGTKMAQAKQRIQDSINEKQEQARLLQETIGKLSDGLAAAQSFIESEACPAEMAEAQPIKKQKGCAQIVDELKDNVLTYARCTQELRQFVNDFRRLFSPRNTFKFRPNILDTDADYLAYADNVDDFVSNNKITDVQQMTSNLYVGILSQISREISDILSSENDINSIVRSVNYDFSQKTFAGVIRDIELRLEDSTMPIVTLMKNINAFYHDHPYEMGEVNLFSSTDQDVINKEAITHLRRLTEELGRVANVDVLHVSDTFSLKFRIVENDNSTGWIDNIKFVGSDGTDILVKAIINILLISVFKERAGKRAGDFRIHCMMDEIGKLADENIQGLLDFANARNIYVVNSSPKAHRPLSYRHLYMLSKDADSNTIVHRLLSVQQAAMK